MLMVYTVGNASKIPVSYEYAHYWRAYCYVCLWGCGCSMHILQSVAEVLSIFASRDVIYPIKNQRTAFRYICAKPLHAGVGVDMKNATKC